MAWHGALRLKHALFFASQTDFPSVVGILPEESDKPEKPQHIVGDTNIRRAREGMELKSPFKEGMSKSPGVACWNPEIGLLAFRKFGDSKM